MDDPRVVKPVLPIRIIVMAVTIGVLVLAFIVYAVWQSGADIAAAKMTGTITEKEFRPDPQDQVILNKTGQITARSIAGEYILTVEVPQKDGTKKPYYVWVNQQLYDSLKVGDKYDVGPALVK